MKRLFFVLGVFVLVVGACGDVSSSPSEGPWSSVLSAVDASPGTSTRSATSSSVPQVVDEVVAPELVVDGSGVAATGGSPEPDVVGAEAGDDGSGPLPLGSVTGVPESVRLDFLFEFCWGPCFRDAHFMDPDNPGVGSGVFTAGAPFHVRHGFVNESDGPLGDGFDVVVYATALDEPGEAGGHAVGATYRYTSDYVIAGTSDACGPTYRDQDGPASCEWFVHEFNDGLPEGRNALWAVWEAPCSAWIDYGFTDSCVDPDEVMSMFSSGFDAPYGSFPPDYTEHNEAP